MSSDRYKSWSGYVCGETDLPVGRDRPQEQPAATTAGDGHTAGIA
jgi:hypothetical protein